MIRQVHWFVFIEFYLPSICLFPLIFISADSVANVFSYLQLFFHFLKVIWIRSILWVLNPEMSGSCVYRVHYIVHCFPCGSDGKAAACNEGDQVRSLGWEDPLEKEMATHSSTLAWKTSWMEKPGKLQSRDGKELDMTEWLHFYVY